MRPPPHQLAAANPHPHNPPCPPPSQLVVLQDGMPVHWEPGSDRMLYLAPPPAHRTAGTDTSGLPYSSFQATCCSSR